MIGSRWHKVIRGLWRYKVHTLLVVLSIAAGVSGIGTVMHMFTITSRDLAQSYTNCQIEGDEGTIPRDLLSAAPITGAAAAYRMIRSPCGSGAGGEGGNRFAPTSSIIASDEAIGITPKLVPRARHCIPIDAFDREMVHAVRRLTGRRSEGTA